MMLRVYTGDGKRVTAAGEDVTDGDRQCPDEAADENPCAVCSVWHVNVDTLPDWILTSVQQAQWTVGKLNCQTCGARLGGFNFTNRSSCPCGQDATVHLNKSRVDPDCKHHVLIVQPRMRTTTRPAGERAALPTDHTEISERRPEFNRTATDSLQLLSGFCPSVLADRSAAVDSTRAGTDDEPPWSRISDPTSQEFDTVAEALGDAVVARSFVSGGRRSLLDQQLLEAVESSGETARVHEEISDQTFFLRGRTASDGVAEREDDTAAERVSASLLDGDEDSERLTCAVCLEVYVRPHSCQPCGHVFCEPCLRTLARNRPANTPCPLCRALISQTDLHQELSHTAETLFPKVVHGRQRIFQNAPCAKWPLPSRRKCFRSFWGFQRRTRRGRRSAHGGVALDFSDIRDWLFDVGLVQTHSVNWILVCLVLGFLTSYFFF
ncbi:hypothetical protein F2P81_015795 [Scophthalmus maximus]|uniref:RING-type domain-containing protein n=1 Tax=Scophthalmus maximus TaxID=52904 RepID=A0A6A4SH82_SCOMX|nr:hypothetical protein F2P81_015795 [Scophthalmus maximus]